MQAPPQPQGAAGPQVRVQVDRKGYDKSLYSTIYPQYIDSNLTPSEGRRLGKAQCVANPVIEEILIALHELGYTDLFVERSKSLPSLQGSEKFAIVPRGCVKVAIKEPADKHYIKKSEFDTQTRNPVKEDIPNKRVLLQRIVERIKARDAPRPELVTAATLLASIPGQPKTKGGK